MLTAQDVEGIMYRNKAKTEHVTEKAAICLLSHIQDGDRIQIINLFAISPRKYIQLLINFYNESKLTSYCAEISKSIHVRSRGQYMLAIEFLKYYGDYFICSNTFFTCNL